MSNKERLAIFLPTEIKAEVKKLAKEKGLTMSSYIRSVMIEHVKNKKK